MPFSCTNHFENFSGFHIDKNKHNAFINTFWSRVIAPVLV